MAEEEESGGEERPSMAQFSALTTYSDLITLMASFFLLMFMIALQEQSKAKATMETVMQAIARQLGNYQPKTVRVQDIGKTPTGMEDPDLHHGQPGKRMEVRSLASDENQKITYGDQLQFDPGSVGLSARAKQALQQEVAPDMRGFENRIEVKGYAVDGGGEKSGNPWDVAYGRAFAVMQYLVTECDMDPRRFDLMVSVEPPSGDQAGHDARRRVDVIMSESARKEPGK